MCKGELLEFMETLQHECNFKTTFEAWRICGSNLGWHTKWPRLMQLGQKIILIPSSTTICKRGFFTPNAIKSHLRSRLNLKTLNAFMLVFRCGLQVDAMDWLGYRLQHLEKHARLKDIYARFIVFFFATNQDCILIILYIYIYIWKYCVTKNWGDILEQNEYVNWHSFLFLKTSRDTLDLKLNVKCNFSNIHTAWV